MMFAKGLRSLSPPSGEAAVLSAETGMLSSAAKPSGFIKNGVPALL